jgi:surface antigen
MKNLFTLILIAVMGVGCASGTNPYMNNANMGGLIGGTGGAVGGAILGKNLKGGAKIAAIGGGAILGMLLGNKVGQWFDEKDKKRNQKLIQKVLEENQDNETGTIQYSKSWSNPNGQTQTGMVTQSATPRNTSRNTYQSQHLGSDGRPLVPSGYNDSLYANNSVQSRADNFYNGVLQQNHVSSGSPTGGGYCRDMQIDISIEGLTTTPQRTQWYKFCRSESGWRQVQ